MCKINILDKLSFILVVIGALNWGFVGLLNFNLVTFITCGIPIISRIIYILIALSGINLISLLFRCKLISLK
ncbi:DUF378 domain-containing protein [Eubacterium multiforme]|uniref:Uncharacterized membrane protein YuzA (DUF378 family) n=1 Tax=Eubacterium multiforme TaxID=83339 RepID=A0ABT9UQQ2_9FIRM|nr:DUF378 domain-containing protein [Eubacterium multiforme]MDQ0148971.1 uncharacterized membrane protein YuzA (DUF378 family) [Eubacterium multiforme]